MASRPPDTPGSPEGDGERATSPQLVAEYDIDHFLLGEEAEAEVSQLECSLDDTNSIVEELHSIIVTTLSEKKPTIVSTLLSEHNHVGLRRDAIRNAFFDNIITLHLRRLIDISVHNGDEEAAQAYRDVLNIMLNLIRNDMLHGVYDPNNAKWIDRASRIGRFSGNTIHMYLPGNGIRERAVTRQSPSGHLLRPALPVHPDDSGNNYRD